ncbi:hypothetical protein [Flagellimonas algicola]|uniref:Uncharacterized protein n=1 Tax=Flagellimonas algicola TaxID=2583815 RepID=A0ABY2WL34_9FLAO|nr:hypothetical protein [Allomuricauda algicola]TMU55251.1 hypothetical protein FGG15_13805 [Allomuricauda algicola]
MLKAIAHPFICFMLIFSILAPSIAPLVDRDCSIAIHMDSGDEEKKSEKESEKKFGEKDLFLSPFSSDNNFFDQYAKVENTEDPSLLSDVTTEILLPPPEKLV